MTARAASSRPAGRRWLAWIPWATPLLLVAVALVLPPNRGDGQALATPTSLFLLLTLQAVTFATVGLVISRAQPHNSVSHLFASVGVFVGLFLATERYQHYALVVRLGQLPLAELAAWLQTWLYVPALGFFATLLPQLFPTGRPLSRRWYPALGLAALSCLGLALTEALRPGRLDQSPAAEQLDLEALSADLRGVVQDTVAQAHVSLWLRSPRA